MTAAARLILPIALLLGLLGDWLFRAHEVRAGHATWALVALAVAGWLSERFGDADGRSERRLLIGAAAAITLLLVLRDAPLLMVFNGVAILVTLLVVAWRALGRPLASLEPRDSLIGGVAAAASLVGGAPTLALRDAQADALGAEFRGSYKTFGIGAIVAVPVLVMVTGLLASADPLFAGFLEEAGALLDTNLAEHIGITLATTWVAAGALRGAIAPLGVTAERFRTRWDLPFSTFLPVLGGLTLLLSAWIGLQVRTLFGGAEYIATTSGVTVAEYARRGFFELVLIAGLVLAVLLVTDDLLDRNAARARQTFRSLGLLLVGLVGALLVSALLRLGLYLRYYGLTTERVAALSVLIWVGLTLAWFAVTVLRGQRQRFAPGVLIISALWIGGLNLANPERWVVETNIRRAERGQEFDIAYHAQLSADALPALRSSAIRLGALRETELKAALDATWAQRNARRAGDWREWTLPYLRHGRTQ